VAILIPIIFILWITTALKNVMFWIYLWQVKEYRKDRMLVHLTLSTSRNLLFGKRNIWLVVLLILTLLPFALALNTSSFLMLGLYSFFAIRTLQQLQAKSLKLPRFTMRTLLIVTSAILFYLGLSVLVAIQLNKFILAWFLIADILTPLFVSLFVLITFPISAWSKNRIIVKATKKLRGLKNLLVIGITGSYGKSSVKEVLAAILQEKFSVVKTPQNINTDIGIARVILQNITKKHNVFIAEMGAYRKGEIKKSAGMARPQIGIITGINPQHISLFGSLQNIQEAKYELIEALPSKGLAIFNGDNENVRSLFRQCKNPKRIYSTDPFMEKDSQKITVKYIENTSRGLNLSIFEKNKGDILLKTKLLGKHNAINILGAVTIARELDVSYRDIKKGLLKMNASPHTLQIRKGIKSSIVIDDAYAANEDGVMAALEVLNNMKEGPISIKTSTSLAGDGKSGRARRSKKICIMQPLIELGDSSERVHKKIASRVAEVCDYLIMTGRDYFSIMFKEALDNGMNKENVFCLPKPQEALRKAQEIIEEGDVILIENRIPEAVLNGVVLHK